MKTKFLRILSSFLLVFAFGFTVQAQSISGTVTDDNGVPLPGATVLVQGTTNGVSQLMLPQGIPWCSALLDTLHNQF
ncbi:MAG: hypothetical protein DBW79_04620 [Cryomorphaceae bacterium]|nr:MAG: hypothetical protein DBW79_04620 [Cryomorphaceae bacterium]